MSFEEHRGSSKNIGVITTVIKIQNSNLIPNVSSCLFWSVPLPQTQPLVIIYNWFLIYIFSCEK